jgi:hypothetical protein
VNDTPILRTSVVTPDGLGEILFVEPTISDDIDIFHVHTTSGVATFYADELIFLSP